MPSVVLLQTLKRGRGRRPAPSWPRRVVLPGLSFLLRVLPWGHQIQVTVLQRSLPGAERLCARCPSPTPLPSASATVSPAEGRGGASWPLFFLQKRCSAEPGTTGFPAGTPGLVLPALILGTVPGASLADRPSVPPSKVSEASALAAVCAGGPRRAAGPESGSVGPASARCQMGLPGKTGGMGDQLRATAGRRGVPVGGRAGGAVSGPRRACPEEGRYFRVSIPERTGGREVLGGLVPCQGNSVVR